MQHTRETPMIISSSYRYFQLKFVITIFLLNFFHFKVLSFFPHILSYNVKKLLLNIISKYNITITTKRAKKKFL